MSNTLKKIDKVLTDFLEKLITLFFIMIFLIVFILIVLRYLFSGSILGGNELITSLFIYTSSLGAAIMIRHREHIKISFFVDSLKPLPQKILIIADYILIIILNYTMFTHSIPWLKATWTFRSPMLNMPYWVEEITIPIGSGIAIFYCFLNIVRILIDKKEITSGTFFSDPESRDLPQESNLSLK